jgi:hypothetical protein
MRCGEPGANAAVAVHASRGPGRRVVDMAARHMKPFRFIVLLVASALLAAIVSGIITMVGWGARIEDKAFHCWDIGFGSYWTDIDSHARAGDTISSGWTWKQLESVRLHYIEAFWLLWAVIASILFWIFQKLRPDKSTARNAEARRRFEPAATAPLFPDSKSGFTSGEL